MKASETMTPTSAMQRMALYFSALCRTANRTRFLRSNLLTI